MRPLAFALLLAPALAAAQPDRGQPPRFIYGVDYQFDKLVATRSVHDKADSGTLRLVSLVYTPLKANRHEVVLLMHGSTGGMGRSPREPLSAPPLAVVQYFVSRGYTLVAPFRRGRDESTGTYVEECSAHTGECDGIPNAARNAMSLESALADTYAVLDQVVFGKLVPKGAKIIAAGHSRGGFLALVLAGERPSQVKGVVNFAGGWNAMDTSLTATELERRLALQDVALAPAARKAAVPTIWIYAAGDRFYSDAGRAGILRLWRDAGGKAEYLFVAEHTLPNAHFVHSDARYWRESMDRFLERLP